MKSYMSSFTSVADSGVREPHPTGAVRDTRDGKGRYDLISPFALARLARHYQNGAAKYQDRNWEKGMAISRFLDSAKRHLEAFHMGDASEDHLAAAAWNIFCIMHFEEVLPSCPDPQNFTIFDLPTYTRRTYDKTDGKIPEAQES